MSLRSNGARSPLSRSLLLVSLTCACAAVDARSNPRGDEPEAALYEVADRQCQTAEEDPQECALIQFVELVHGTFFGVPPEQLALVLWLSEQPESDRFTYGATDLRGKRVGNEFVMEANDRRRAWLVMENDIVREYRVDQRAGLHGEPSSSTRLVLKRVPRTSELAARLRYPEQLPAD